MSDDNPIEERHLGLPKRTWLILEQVAIDNAITLDVLMRELIFRGIDATGPSKMLPKTRQ